MVSTTLTNHATPFESKLEITQIREKQQSKRCNENTNILYEKYQLNASNPRLKTSKKSITEKTKGKINIKNSIASKEKYQLTNYRSITI